MPTGTAASCLCQTSRSWCAMRTNRILGTIEQSTANVTGTPQPCSHAPRQCLAMHASGLKPSQQDQAQPHGLVLSQALATKKGAMRALGRLARSDEAASELVAAEGLPPMIALLDCSDPGLVRR